MSEEVRGRLSLGIWALLEGKAAEASQSAPVERQSQPPSPSNSLVNEPTRDRGPRAVLGGRTSGHNEREHS